MSYARLVRPLLFPCLGRAERFDTGPASDRYRVGWRLRLDYTPSLPVFMPGSPVEVLGAERLQPAESPFLVGLDQARIARHIGREDPAASRRV